MSLKILAIDTTTDACSAALLYRESIRTRYQLAPRQHAHLILSMLGDLLTEAALQPRDLDAVAVCRGPGSFTGCRIGVSVAQAIAFAGAIPVVVVSSLQCLAQGVYLDFQAERALVAMDARRNEIYWGSYQVGTEGMMFAVEAEQLADPKHVLFGEFSHFVGVGSGWDIYHDILMSQCADGQLQECYPARYPRATDVVVLAKHAYQHGQLVPAERALPVYLRDNITRPIRIVRDVDE